VHGVQCLYSMCSWYFIIIIMTITLIILIIMRMIIMTVIIIIILGSARILRKVLDDRILSGCLVVA